MSYDYFFFRKRASDEKLTLENLERNVESIGSVDSVKAAITELFPATQWSEFKDAWFGVCGPPDFLVSADPDGGLISFKASRIERGEVEMLAAKMDLIVFDPQKAELF